MNTWVRTLENDIRKEQGMALPMALFALVMLSGLLLALLSMAGMEPEIATNLNDTTRSRYLADAGIEWAYDQLIINPSWNTVLSTNGGVMTPQGGQELLPGAPQLGSYAVQVRNDVQPGDTALTGLPALDAGGATNDTNGAVIVSASGTYQGLTRRIQVVMHRLALPPIPGAYSMPGFQADLWFQNDNFDIDGRDWICTANCNDPDPANRTYELSPDQSNMRYGIAVQRGYQKNLGEDGDDGDDGDDDDDGMTYERRAEYKLDTKPKQNNVQGKDQKNPSQSTTGLNSVAPDKSLNPAVMQNFLDALAAFSDTAVLQSTIACPMVLDGSASDPSKPTLSNGCGVNQTLDLGSRSNPKLVYFRGELDPTSTFTGLKLQGKPIQGAGILVIEDGDLRVTNHFHWDGIVIVQGRYVSSIFLDGAKAAVYGATISNETVWDEETSGGGTLWDGYFRAADDVKLRNSQEALDLVQRALLFRMSTWREL